MDVLCIGQLVADILVKSIDYVNFDIDTSRVDQICVKNGGDCLNTAIDLAKLGNEVGVVGKVGNDSFGEFLIKTAKDYGIDTRGLQVSNESSTSSVVVLINSKGERVFFYYGGSNDFFKYEDIDISIIDDYKIIHVGGTYLLPLFDGNGAAELFKQAHFKNKLTSMDVTWDTTGRWLEVIKPCLKYLNFFMPSYKEACLIAKEEKPEEIASFLQNEGIEVVVIKLGKDGCYIKGSGKGFYQKASIVEIVDTTGAGDAFVAGFLTGVLKNWKLEECANFASAVSAHCIQHLGATTGIPKYEEVIKFLKNGNNARS